MEYVIEILPGGCQGTTDPSVDIRTADDLTTSFRNNSVSAP